MITFDQTEVTALSSKPLYNGEVESLFANPPEDIQRQFVGATFSNAYGAASQFLNYLFQQFDGTKEARVLDFGAGWGRMLRLIRNKPELDHIDLHGCDIDRTMLELCRKTIPRTTLNPVELFPPSPYRSGFFDVIYANSVFSHLGERNHLAWAQEFARIVRPGGLVVLTTQAKHFLQVCEELRSGKRPIETIWHKNLAQGFASPSCGEQYDKGEFLYHPHTVRPNPEIYGDAIVPKAFFAEHWGTLGFDLIDWFEHPDIFGQNRAVLRRSS